MKVRTSSIDKETLIIFSRQLALIVDSQISVHEGLMLIKDKAQNRGLVEMIEKVILSIDSGATFSEAFQQNADRLPTFFVNMVEIGEKSGNLTNVLEQVATAYEKELDTRDKVKSAISYPLILSVLMLAVVVLLVVQILPMFNDVLESLGGTMPLITRVMLSISQFIGQNIFVLILIICLLTAGLIYFKRTEKGKLFFDRLSLFMPVQKEITASVIAANFSRNLGILIRSGIDIRSAILMIIPTIGNLFFEERLKRAVDMIDKGENLETVMDSLKIYPWVLLKLFSVAQSTGHLDEVLERAAIEMTKETDKRLKRLTTVIEPLLIMILSMIVGVVLLSVVLPVVRIMNAIG